MTFSSCLLLTTLYFSPTLSIITRQTMDNLRQQQGPLEMARFDRRIHEEEHLEKFASCMLNKFRISYVLITDDPGSFLAARKGATLAGANVRDTARQITNCLLRTDIIVMDPQ